MQHGFFIIIIFRALSPCMQILKASTPEICTLEYETVGTGQFVVFRVTLSRFLIELQMTMDGPSGNSI